MAKRRKKGKGHRRKGRGKKSKKSSAKHSAALEATGLWGAYKAATADTYGATLGKRLMQAPFDGAQRAVIANMAKDGTLRRVLVDNTREFQAVAAVKILQRLPVTRGPTNMVVSAINSAGRALGIKGKWKVI